MGTPSLTFEMLQQHPEKYKGQIILLGGDIVSIEATPEGPILLKVRQKPLDSHGAPSMNAPSGGGISGCNMKAATLRNSASGVVWP